MLLSATSSDDPRVILELSDSCGSSSTSITRDSGPAPAYPLKVSVQSLRTIGATLSVALTIVGFVIFFTVFDIDLISFSSVDKNDDQRKDLLDYYNSISGSIANAIEKIIGVVLQAVIAIGMLSFATEITLYDYRRWYSRYTAVIVAAAIGFLITSGLSALNVQIVPGQITLRMTMEDLVTTEATTFATSDGVLAMAWNKSTSELTKGNPVLNTVFRSFILPFDASSDGICTNSEYAFSQPSVSFGYPSRSWHSRAVLDVSGTQQAVQFNLNTDLDELNDESLPFKENVARDLLLDLFRYGWSWEVELINISDSVMADIFYSDDVLAWKFAQNQSAESFSLGELVNLTEDTRDDDNFLQASTRMLRSALKFDDDNTSSTTVNYSTVKYARVPISDTVMFDSITLEIAYPSDLQLLTTNYHCSRNGCWDKSQLDADTKYFKQDVRAYGQCLNKDRTEETRFYRDDDSSVVNNSCVDIANSSMRIFSGGKRIAGDMWKYTPPEGTETPGMVHMTNVREIYSVTMGRLSWQFQDLSTLYGAECTAVTCRGIRAIVNESDTNTTHLLLGEPGIPLHMVKYTPIAYASAGDFWTSLVQVLGPEKFKMTAVLPRMFNHLNDDADKMKLLRGLECSQENEIVIDHALKNHLYTEDSHQTACIAAFHFLFQNAIERQQIEIGNTVASTQEPKLRFIGNDYQMAVRASIPIVSVVLSVLGCTVLLVIGVASVCYRNRSTSRFAELTGPRTVAEAMINDSKFPSWLLHLTLERERGCIVPLDQFQIRNVELVHESKANDAIEVSV
ncbi:hypothetical protein P3T76_007984 [Phytophthora citrophthora]|uniref:Transmembrane protein n=1 Tax=Phytophthora citrophthora TaxID=4793 RepID=A0AAD9GLU3_9STRA|nr:hypothetical protein P3T76_007984 [Phytophthora citrophthora]